MLKEGFMSRVRFNLELKSRYVVCAKSLQWRLTLWDPLDYSPSGSSVHGIFQERILERVAMPFSRGPS